MQHFLNKITLAVAATALCGAAVAGDYKKDDMMTDAEAPTFEQLDRNNNGTLTKMEVKEANERMATGTLTDKWSELDTNEDGELDQAEFARFEPVTDQHSEKEKSDNGYDS